MINKTPHRIVLTTDRSAVDRNRKRPASDGGIGSNNLRRDSYVIVAAPAPGRSSACGGGNASVSEVADVNWPAINPRFNDGWRRKEFCLKPAAIGSDNARPKWSDRPHLKVCQDVGGQNCRQQYDGNQRSNNAAAVVVHPLILPARQSEPPRQRRLGHGRLSVAG